MSYRFVKVTTFYTAYLDDYYSRNPGIETGSYENQLKHLMADAFSWADSYSRNLRAIGVEAHEIVANADFLQTAWAKEHGVEKSGKELVVEQLKHIRPDVVMFQNSFVHNGDFIRELKAQIPSIRQTIGWCCAPYTQDDIRAFRGFDYMLTCNPGKVIEFKKHGLLAYRLNHAFDKSLLPRIKQDNGFPESDVFFAGQIATSSGSFHKRKEMIEELVEKGVDLIIYSPLRKQKSYKSYLKQGIYNISHAFQICGLGKLFSRIPFVNKGYNWGDCVSTLKFQKKIEKITCPPIFGLRMLQALSKAKVGFNIHIDSSGQYAANVRLFEVTGVGTCLVTDFKSNMRDFFDPDYEVVMYRNSEECKEKILWLLEHPKERQKIAKAGQRRVIKDHTYAHRAQHLNEIIRRQMR